MRLRRFLHIGAIFTLIIIIFVIYHLTYHYLNNDIKLPITVVAHSNFDESRKQNKTILLWTPFFGNREYIYHLSHYGCGDLTCVFTSNRSQLQVSDAIVFHLRDTSIKDLPSWRSKAQRWIMLHHESPMHTPNILTALNGKINWTVTYRKDSDICLSPIRYPISPTLATPLAINFSNRTRLVAWFVSNCNTPSRREDYVKELRKSISVDIYGSCGEKVCTPKMSKECLQKISEQYYFYLAFENSLCKDYITEKLFDVLEHDIIPVVLGGADYSSIAPPGSYINALDFESPRHLGQFLLTIAKDYTKYIRYFNWRNLYKMTGLPYPCQICQKLHESHSPKVYENLHDWWFKNVGCTSWNYSSSE